VGTKGYELESNTRSTLGMNVLTFRKSGPTGPFPPLPYCDHTAANCQGAHGGSLCAKLHRS
jgi:hypothetical protein